MEDLRKEYMNEIVTSQETPQNLTTESDLSDISLSAAKTSENLGNSRGKVSSGILYLHYYYNEEISVPYGCTAGTGPTYSDHAALSAWLGKQ